MNGWQGSWWVLLSIPLVTALAVILLPLNDGYYELWVNYDPQGDAQQHEWQYTTRAFRYTSGVLCGQLVALLAGAALAVRHRAWALAAAVPLGVLLAAVTFAVAYARDGRGPLDDVGIARLVAVELAAFPLFAAVGVGLGLLLARRWRLLPLALPAFAVLWAIGLMQDDRWAGPMWILWLLPPLAAAAAIPLTTMSVDVGADPPVTLGDGGQGALIALVGGLLLYAGSLHLLGLVLDRRRRRANRSAGV
ncbi:hypothetical protein [Micromonospora sp. CPCC 206061]|uniref:hypothetical protein n=1 Tax=Micromonospora sp. CPCC 206061 TaxID=3122410 RepID=UPI002FF140C2